MLVRSAPFGIHNQDWTNAMLGLLSVPSLNSWDSLLKCQHKPVIYNHLLQLRKKMGTSAPGVYNFPLIPQTYYASYRGFAFCSGFPLVLKLGTVHAGYGKAKVETQEQWEDMKSLVALQGRYATTEPFIKWDYDFRVQKIGSHYRAFRRFSENWVCIACVFGPFLLARLFRRRERELVGSTTKTFQSRINCALGWTLLQMLWGWTFARYTEIFSPLLLLSLFFLVSLTVT